MLYQLSNVGQDLSTVFMCCSLGFRLKILPYEFFLMGWKCIFLIKKEI